MPLPPWLPWVLAALAGLAAVVFAVLWRSYRRRLYGALGRDDAHPVPTVALEDFHPRFRRDELGPTLDAAVRFVGTGDGVPGGTSDREAWVLAVLAKDARTLFEFGTATGRTAWLWAANAPAEARVHTLTLPPGGLEAYREAPGDSAAGTRRALEESAFTRFRYTGTEVEDRIEQLFGDSKVFDEGPFVGRCDLVFVDGSHARSYVESDSEKALRMVAPGGIVLWHDYRRDRRSARDVCRVLNELGARYPLVRLAGTSLVAYRARGERNVQSSNR